MKKIDNDSDETDPQFFGSLMYLVNTRLDSFHLVNGLIHFMNQPRQITRRQQNMYIRGTVGYGLRYSSNMNLSFHDMTIQIGQKV
jgi:hypothetical protein